MLSNRDGPKFGQMFGWVWLGNMWLFGRSLAKIRRHLWLCICGVLRLPLTLTWSHSTYY